MSAQVQFIESGLSLIHIPLHLYPYFVQPILRLLFLSDDDEGRTAEGQAQREPWASSHRFLNISVTPLECSVVCSRQHAKELFVPHLAALGQLGDEVSISVDDYMVIQVDGDGLDAGRRVVELTSPLALAGISIFFITTYFADYILVPTKSRGQVVSALEQRGFVFEKHTEAFVNQAHHQQTAYQHHRNQSSGSSIDRPPQTPPPSNLDELQTRTFSLLRRQNVVPTVDPSIRLIQCAGRKDTGRDGRSAHMLQLQLGLAKCFVGQPRFLNLTLTDTEPASVLFEKRLLSHFRADEDVLLGTRQDVLIPIILDLRGLPLESTGIVCGVAGRLVGAANSFAPFAGTESYTSNGSTNIHIIGPSMSDVTTTPTVIDMSYLSTVRAGTVMVSEADLQKATEALRI